MFKYNIIANKSLFKTDSKVWVSAVAIALPLFLLFSFLIIIIKYSLQAFWPADLELFTLNDGKKIIGQRIIEEKYFDDENDKPVNRIQIKQANRDVQAQDFIWLNKDEISSISKPLDLILIERSEWGNLIGYVKELRIANKQTTLSDKANDKLNSLLNESKLLNSKIKHLLKNDLGKINYQEEKLKLKLKDATEDEAKTILNNLEQLKKQYDTIEKQVQELRKKNTNELIINTASGENVNTNFANIVRIIYPNQLNVFNKVVVFFAKIFEFISSEPRESNTEGGVFPAIFGTAVLVMIMSIIVTPLGVLTAIYLREYAKQGKIVSLIRIAVNNLAGVPSIVFGVCGVGFFIYRLGGSIDQLFYSHALPTPTFGTGGILWASLTLALLTLPTVIVVTEEGLAMIPMHLREASYALGATKFETIRNVVLPCLLPSILTSTILAVARAAGEVAPLMLTGVVKLAPSMPIDSYFPYIHLERKFMHLGFHIYDMGFQSPNVDAARPMVFATTLLLLLIVVLLNLSAMLLRNKLKKRFVGAY